MLDEARWMRALPRELSQEEWLLRGAPEPSPDYRLPYKACWACGVRASPAVRLNTKGGREPPPPFYLLLLFVSPVGVKRGGYNKEL